MENQNNENQVVEPEVQEPENKLAEVSQEVKEPVQTQQPTVSSVQEPVNRNNGRKRRRGKWRGLVGRNKDAIMSDAEMRKKSKKMGAISIVLCVLSLALIYPLMWLGAQIVVYAFTHFLFVIGNLIVAVLGLALPTVLFYAQIYQISFMSAQLHIRKDAFGWVCLAISIITVIGVLVLGFFSIKPVLDVTFGAM